MKQKGYACLLPNSRLVDVRVLIPQVLLAGSHAEIQSLRFMVMQAMIHYQH